MKKIKVVGLILAVVLIATLITLSILGAKERTGYFTEFKLDNRLPRIEENYNYHFRIRYYDKTFRNSDIYGVYPKTDNLPEYIKSVKFEGMGSPYGNILSSKDLNFDEKIDNVSYVLRVKGFIVKIIFRIVVSIGIFILLEKITYLYKSVLEKLHPTIYTNIFNSYHIYVIALFIIAVFLNLGSINISSWDAINYISNGISFFEHGKQGFVYPGTLFSIVNVFLSGLIFKNYQFSSFVYLSIIPLCVTIIFSYKMIRMYVSRNEALVFLLLIFLFYNPHASIPNMLIHPYTDGWLLMFCILVSYSIIKERVLIAGLLVAIAHFYRGAQALPILLFAIILLPKYSVKKIATYYISIGLAIIFIDKILNLFFVMLSKEQTFYRSFFTRLPFTALNIKDIFLDIINVIWAFRISTIPIAISLIIIIIGLIKVKDRKDIQKLAIFSVIISAVCFAGGLFIQKEFGSREETLRRLGENRYFIYAVMFSSMVAFIYINDFFLKRKHHFKNIKIFFIILIVVATLFDLGINVRGIKKIKNRIHFADYSNDYPKIKERASIYSLDLMPHGTVSYILKTENSYIISGGPDAFSAFFTNDNSKIDYLFSTVDNEIQLIDNHGIKFNRIWRSSYKNSQYTLFEREDLETGRK